MLFFSFLLLTATGFSRSSFSATTHSNKLNASQFTIGIRSSSSPIHLGFQRISSLYSSSKGIGLQQQRIQLFRTTATETGFLRNRRNMYSCIWAFTSLNYLYADLAGLMDANVLRQYMNGNVGGMAITPGFLTVAAGFMQIPLANVFIPQVIKNDRTLRWIQISSGAVMTLVQAGTLFMGKPTPYYALFSAIEIAATSFITIDAIRWKTTPPKPQQF